MTLVVIIGIITSFSIRTSGTIFPRIFSNIYMVKGTVLINAFFILAHLLFWLLFYKEYVSTKGTILKRTCILAIIGSFAVSFLYIKNLPFAFDVQVNFPSFLMNPYIEVFVPLIGSVFHLIFFVVFSKSLDLEEKAILSKPILSITIGISIFLLFHLMVLFNFISRNRLEWLDHMPRAVAVGTVPFLIMAVILILTFYYRFYYFLDLWCKGNLGGECSSEKWPTTFPGGST